MTTEPGSGWRPGIVGWIVMQHGEYYAREWDFGAYFEAKVAREVGEFVDRLDKDYNHLLWEIDALGPLAAVSVDGDYAENGLAHLRWFIASDRGKGQGGGRDMQFLGGHCKRHVPRRCFKGTKRGQRRQAVGHFT